MINFECKKKYEERKQNKRMAIDKDVKMKQIMILFLFFNSYFLLKKNKILIYVYNQNYLFLYKNDFLPLKFSKKHKKKQE